MVEDRTSHHTIVGLRLILQIFQSFGNLHSFLTDSKVRTLSYRPAKTNENGTVELLIKSICTGRDSRKAGPTGYTWIPTRWM